MFPFDIIHPVVGKASVEINKPVQDVFRFVGERFFDNYPRWAAEVSEVIPLTGQNVFEGAKAKQIRQEEHGETIESILEVSEFEPFKKMTLKVVNAPFRNTYQFSTKNDKDVTKLEYSFEILELEPFMWPFEKMIRTAAQEGTENTVANIKNLMAENTLKAKRLAKKSRILSS